MHVTGNFKIGHFGQKHTQSQIVAYWAATFAAKKQDLRHSFELDTIPNQRLLIYTSTDSVYLFLDILNVGCGPDHPKVIIEETFVKISHYFWFPAPRRTREQFRFILLWSKINVLPHLLTSSHNYKICKIYTNLVRTFDSFSFNLLL